MKDDSRNFIVPGGDIGSGVESRSNNESATRAAASSRGWAWAHASDVYDWMDSAVPFSNDDLAG